MTGDGYLRSPEEVTSGPRPGNSRRQERAKQGALGERSLVVGADKVGWEPARQAGARSPDRRPPDSSKQRGDRA